MDVGTAIGQPRAVGAAHDVRSLFRPAVVQLAGDRRQQVDRGHDPFDDPIFIDHDRQMSGTAPEQLDQPHHRRAVGAP